MSGGPGADVCTPGEPEVPRSQDSNRARFAPAEVLGFDSHEISMAAADRELYAVYHEFAGEGHGFRRAETVIACLTAEAAFYARLLASDRTVR